MDARSGASSIGYGDSSNGGNGSNGSSSSSPETEKSPPVRWLDLPNKTQLFLLALCRLSEPLSNVCLLPYIFHLVGSALADAGPGDTSLYSGLLVASFPLAQFAVSLPWGYLSDRWGRRTSIVAGLLVSAVANAAFGFATGIGWLFFWRALAGAANGNVGIMRTATAEAVGERRFQTRAFLLLPLVFNSGMVVSLALGGLLADPVANLPGLFGPGGALDWGGRGAGVRWMAEYPFALPALWNASVLGSVLVLAVLGLRETLPGREGERDWGITAGQRVARFVSCTAARRRDRARYRLLLDDDDHNDSDDAGGLGEHGEEIQLRGAKPSAPGPASTSAPAVGRRGPPLPFRQIWTRRTVAAMVSFGLLPLHNSAFMHILPVYLSTPRDTSAPGAFPAMRFTGGLGLHPRTIGLGLGLSGTCGILFQLYLFPRWQARAGTLGVFRASLLVFPAVYALAPFLGVLPEGSGWGWAALAAVVGGQVMARTVAIPSTVILLTEAAPAGGAVLGTVHGAGNMLASLARAAGPAAGGWVYARGVREHMIGAVWWFYLDAAALAALAWCVVMQREGRTDE